MRRHQSRGRNLHRVTFAPLFALCLSFSAPAALAQGFGAKPCEEGRAGFVVRFRSSRHYCPEPLVEAEPKASNDPETVFRATTRHAKIAAPRDRAGAIATIHQVAARYAEHPTLKRLELSKRQWHALFQAMVKVESAYNPRAVSHAGAIGLAQLMPGTAKVLRVNPHDPVQNLDGGARYLLTQMERFGSITLALAAYNAGPGAVQKHGGVPPYRETRNHVIRVTREYERILPTL